MIDNTSYNPSVPPSSSSPLYFLPLGPRVLLRRLDQDTAASLTSTSATFSGFVVPETAKEKVTLCEVVAIPSSSYRTEFGTTLTCPVQEGDTVLIGKYTGSEHKVRGKDGKEEELLYVRWEELLGVKRDTAARYGGIARDATSHIHHKKEKGERAISAPKSTYHEMTKVILDSLKRAQYPPTPALNETPVSASASYCPNCRTFHTLDEHCSPSASSTSATTSARKDTSL